MRRATAVIGALALVVASASVFAQAKPSFAGKWVLVPPADAAAGGGGGGGRGGGRGGGFGNEFTIAQTDKTLTITRMGQDGTAMAPTVYNIGGESKISMPGRGGGAPTEVVAKTAWEGNNLVITTATANGEQKRVLSLTGGNLTIATTNPGREGGAPTTNTATYKKG